MELKNNNYALTLNENEGSVCLEGKSVIFNQHKMCDDYKITNVKEENNALLFSLKDKKRDIPFDCKYTFTGENELTFTVNSDGKLEGEFMYPPAIRHNKDHRIYLPFYEGISFMADDVIRISPRPMLKMTGGTYLSMGFMVFTNPDSSWLLCAFVTSSDGQIFTNWEDGIFKCDISWEAEKEMFAYPREIRYIWGDKGGVTALCKAYKKIAEEKGYVVPLTEKAKKVENVKKLIGSCDVWLWNDDAMDLLYSDTTPYSIPTDEQKKRRLEIAKDMKKSGMDNVLWSIFNENIDTKLVEEVKKLGFLTTIYDVYTDVIPDHIFDMIPKTRQERCKARIPFWPKAIVKEKDGTNRKAWELKGIDGNFYPQERICDAAAIEIANGIIPKRGKETGIEGTFMDVTGTSGMECYDENHPMTNSTSWYYKNKLLSVVTDANQICGTEIGCEDVAKSIHYNEGMLSPSPYRAHDSGRRMTHIYEGENIPEYFTQYMLNPKYRVPLWELIYHGCVASYWYWGDSSNCAPSLMDARDRFLALYGLAPIFSFKASDWERLKEKIIKSYNTTVAHAKNVGFETMESFDYLTEDCMIQKTTFSNGVTVTVNFDEKERELFGKTFKAGEILIEQ